MKKLKYIFLLACFVMFSGILTSAILVKCYSLKDVDTVAINKIINESLNYWDNLNELDNISFSYDFIILDTNENILYSKGNHKFNSIESTIKKHDTYKDIIKDNKKIGTVIIFTHVNDDIISFKHKISRILLISYVLIVFSFILYFYCLYKNILFPFKNLQNFAGQIASGNLDAPLLMDKNNIFGAFTESFDIMREELNKAKEKEYLANKSKKELVASLSHDIKTPTTSIQLISELLLASTDDEKVKSKISTIYNKANEINHLITDMFNAALEELQELNVNVSEEYSYSLETLFKNADYYNLVNISHIPPCIIRTDLLRLQQVINNIITNSYKYADTKIDVTFSLEKYYLKVNIKDYGEGVSTDEIPFLFNKFYRGKNSAIKKQNGSGLGLYISKYLMNKMDGEISCFTETDGFKVELLIPLI